MLMPMVSWVFEERIFVDERILTSHRIVTDGLHRRCDRARTTDEKKSALIIFYVYAIHIFIL